MIPPHTYGEDDDDDFQRDFGKHDDADDQPLLQEMYALLPEVCTFLMEVESSNKTNFLDMVRLMKTGDFSVIWIFISFAGMWYSTSNTSGIR